MWLHLAPVHELLRQNIYHPAVVTADIYVSMKILNRMNFAGRNFLRCVEGRTDSLLNVTVINDSGTTFEEMMLHAQARTSAW